MSFAYNYYTVDSAKGNGAIPPTHEWCGFPYLLRVGERDTLADGEDAAWAEAKRLAEDDEDGYLAERRP